MKNLFFLLLTVLFLCLGACTSVADPATAVPVSPGEGDPYPVDSPTETAPALPTAPPAEDQPDAAYPVPTPVPPRVDDSYPAPPPTVAPPADSGYPVDAGLGERRAVVALAVQALAERLTIDASQVVVQLVEERDWADGSLGCPAEGMMYTTVITPGFFIQLEVDGERFNYHTDRSGNLVLCGDDGRPDGS